MDPVTRSSCPLCGRPHTPADARGLGWSSEHTPTGVVWICGPCTRVHLVEIETGLPVRPLDLRAVA
ncbi:hypothetical protein EV383_3059 [Pseudonocardia sediminis]|uniref:Uncharacterized protein n=1 Tax=Pseudonocardia sediminis TaxID=1397368 RepID=A0A4V2FQV3_PSEST|nr:hypothetical protein [Pseudonocardia sediminis]RZT86170.1 hypothetical protein EV383_3059 [Pseudonocardia sediminis]